MSESAHEHPDCVLIAMEWLSAQTRTKSPCRKLFPVKHMIEAWAGRYLSQDDVSVAAKKLNLPGRYPYFFISARLTLPDLRRLNPIGEAGKHSSSYDPEKYAGLNRLYENNEVEDHE